MSINFNFDKERQLNTNKEVQVESEYDIPTDVMIITIKNAKKGFKKAKNTDNLVCPINHYVKRSLKLNGNLILFP